MQVVITMAGRGSRFRDKGYGVPKYRALAKGKPLFDWSLESLSDFISGGAKFTFIMRREDASAEFVRSRADLLGVAKASILEIDEVTDGQATTAMLAVPVIGDTAEPIAIYNIDTHVAPGALRRDAVRGDGWLPCFQAAGDSWSFAATGADNRVTEVREKHRISPYATIGFYYFRSLALYERLYHRTFAAGAPLDAGERYIAPMYNALIRDGGEVFITDLPVDSVIPLGTPEEVKAFDAEADPSRVA